MPRNPKKDRSHSLEGTGTRETAWGRRSDRTLVTPNPLHSIYRALHKSKTRSASSFDRWDVISTSSQGSSVRSERVSQGLRDPINPLFTRSRSCPAMGDSRQVPHTLTERDFAGTVIGWDQAAAGLSVAQRRHRPRTTFAPRPNQTNHQTLEMSHRETPDDVGRGSTAWNNRLHIERFPLSLPRSQHSTHIPFPTPAPLICSTSCQIPTQILLICPELSFIPSQCLPFTRPPLRTTGPQSSLFLHPS